MGVIVVICIVWFIIEGFYDMISPIIEDVKENPKNIKKVIIFCVIFVLLMIIGTMIDNAI